MKNLKEKIKEICRTKGRYFFESDSNKIEMGLNAKDAYFFNPKEKAEIKELCNTLGFKTKVLYQKDYLAFIK